MNRPLIPRRAPNAPLQRISRRGLITSGVLAGVLAATGVPVHAQRRQGVLRLALPGAVTGWGIGPQDALARVLGAGTVFDTLTEITAGGELVGELAQGWQATDGGAVWTFVLRDDARFHDGQPVTAADLIASIQRHNDPTSPLFWLMDNIAALAAPDPLTLTIRLHHPDPDLPLILADPHLMIAPGGDVESGVGSGLYQAGADPLILTRVAGHWKDGRAGWFDAVALVLTDDPAAALGAGLADVALAEVAGLTTLQVPASGSLLLSPIPAAWPALPASVRAAALPGVEAAHTADPAAFFITHVPGLAHAPAIGNLAPLDSGRIAERWWFA
jgi:peptide/nickel transport system substrate-binding protein